MSCTTAKQDLEKKINELQEIRKKCANETYLSVGMLANFAMRDFLDWHIDELRKLSKKIKE